MLNINQFIGILTCSDFFGVIAKTDFSLLLILLPAVLFTFVGVLVTLFLAGVRFYSFKAFSERSFLKVFVFSFAKSKGSIRGFMLVERFSLSSGTEFLISLLLFCAWS